MSSRLKRIQNRARQQVQDTVLTRKEVFQIISGLKAGEIAEIVIEKLKPWITEEVSRQLVLHDTPTLTPPPGLLDQV